MDQSNVPLLLNLIVIFEGRPGPGLFRGGHDQANYGTARLLKGGGALLRLSLHEQICARVKLGFKFFMKIQRWPQAECAVRAV